MKRRANAAAAVLLAASATASSGAEAQLRAAAGAVALDTLAARFQADMAIPDGPAFLLLPTEPSSVLRPGSVRELALMLSDAFWAGAQPREEAGGDRVRAGFTLRFGAPGAAPESG